MAELATIARPYAEALFKAAGSDAAGVAAQIRAVAGVAADGQLRRFAGNPKVADDQVFELIASLAAGSGGAQPGPIVQNLVRLVIENGRLDALPEVATQFQALVNAGTGTSNAVIHSAFPIEPAALADVTATLERRFGRRLETSVVVDPELIGGIRVVVGDEVLDTSVKARLEQMRTALTA